MHIARLALVFSLALTACANVERDLTADTSGALLDGSPDAIGLVRFVNDSATTFVMLDVDVALDRRAAEGLVAGRPFDSVADIDAVPYVGASALGKLMAYAREAGYVPEGDDLLGTYDGVSFTAAEAARALTIVNEESDGVLRGEVGLDSRAVNSIVNGRPIHTVAELADLYYVGTAMLNRIKNYVEVDPSEPVDCRGDAHCPGEERCIGRPFDGSSEWGMCRDLTPVAGEGAYCNTAIPCTSAALFCSGISLWGEGQCLPLWMSDSFDNTTQRFIPQETSNPVATGVVVRGQASVPVDIAVAIDLAHSDPDSLVIRLRDPNGDEAVVWDGPASGGAAFPGSFVVTGGISRDDTVNGRWMLRVWNVEGRGLGNLHGWTLDVTSRWD